MANRKETQPVHNSFGWILLLTTVPEKLFPAWITYGFPAPHLFCFAETASDQHIQIEVSDQASL